MSQVDFHYKIICKFCNSRGEEGHIPTTVSIDLTDSQGGLRSRSGVPITSGIEK